MAGAPLRKLGTLLCAAMLTASCTGDPLPATTAKPAEDGAGRPAAEGDDQSSDRAGGGTATGNEGRGDGPGARDGAAAGPPSPGPEDTRGRGGKGEGPAGVAPEDPEVPAGDVLDVAIPAPASLDPMRLADPGSTLVARQLYEGLTRWGPVRKRVVPATARSWRASANGTVFSFKLRPAMTFHDGSPVRARDFRFAFDRIARRRSGSPLAYLLEQIDGFRSVNQLGTSKHLRGVRVAGPRRLVIELAQPDRDFPAVLTHPGLVPVRRQALSNRDRWARAPVGNGSFRIAGPWSVGETIVLEDFPRAMRKTNLDGIRFVPHADAAGSWLPFVRGHLDVAEVPPSEANVAARLFGTDDFVPLLAGYYLGLNLRSPGLDRLLVRRAIGRAIDRRHIARAVYRGSLRPPRGIVPSGMPGFRRDACKQLCDHSLEKATRLARRVHPRYRDVRLDYTGGPPHRRVARTVARELERARLAVEVNKYRWPTYLERLETGRAGAYRLGWIAEVPSPGAFLRPLFASGSPDNHSGFSSAKVDGLLDRAAKEESYKRRLRLYRRAEKTVLRRAAVIPLGSFIGRWVERNNVKGLRFDVMGGFDAAGVSLD